MRLRKNRATAKPASNGRPTPRPVPISIVVASLPPLVLSLLVSSTLVAVPDGNSFEDVETTTIGADLALEAAVLVSLRNKSTGPIVHPLTNPDPPMTALI